MVINSKDEKGFINRLIERRNQIFQQMERAEDSESELNSPEIEPEENAKKEKMLWKKELLEDLDKKEIEDIDRALHKLETGSFGACESCGIEITSDRLEVIPWTSYCINCARERENRKTTPTDAARKGSSTSDFDGLSDEELTQAIHEEIRYDGRVNGDELEISCKDGIVYLEGFIEGEFDRQILMDILENNMGLEEIEDHLVSDPILFARDDRRPGKDHPEKRDEDILFQGEGDDDSNEEGLSRAPSDEWMPEKED